jgi:uncharacterized membrane protein
MKFIILLIFMVSCASRPQLYPNQKLKNISEEISKKDIDHCITEADTYMSSGRGKRMAKGAGAGAGIGAAVGAVGGMFTGNFGRGLIRGAAVGAGGGAAANYVNQCLSDKGYQVIGWD